MPDQPQQKDRKVLAFDKVLGEALEFAGMGGDPDIAAISRDLRSALAPQEVRGLEAAVTNLIGRAWEASVALEGHGIEYEIRERLDEAVKQSRSALSEEGDDQGEEDDRALQWKLLDALLIVLVGWEGGPLDCLFSEFDEEVDGEKKKEPFETRVEQMFGEMLIASRRDITDEYETFLTTAGEAKVRDVLRAAANLLSPSQEEGEAEFEKAVDAVYRWLTTYHWCDGGPPDEESINAIRQDIREQLKAAQPYLQSAPQQNYPDSGLD